MLIELARRLTEAVREVDLVARWGGDEFTLLLPKTGLPGALLLAEKSRPRSTTPRSRSTPGRSTSPSLSASPLPGARRRGKNLLAAADDGRCTGPRPAGGTG